MIETIYRTDTGKIRTLNEDSVGVFKREDDLLAVVADGMGGHRAGDIASTMAIAFIEEQWKHIDTELQPAEAEQWLMQTIKAANIHLYELSESNADYSGMGTTIVASICTPNNVTIAHIGDSRIYLLNTSGLSLLTEDHSLVNELMKSGQITEEEAEDHPRKHMLLRALGTEKKSSIDTRSLHWEQEDIVLLCSDGLTNKVNDKIIEKVMRSETSLSNKADQLIHLANRAGGEDNTTIVLIKQSPSNDEDGDNK